MENGKPYAGIGDGTAFTTSNKTFSLPLGQWHHLAAVYDNAADRLWMYLDGELQEEIAITRELPYKTGVSLSIGADNEGAANFFTGLIDEAAVFNNALDAGQIHTLYAKGLNGRDYCAEDLCGNGETD
ncbi:MAG: LamG domain-containing protein, partial [Desulfosalsimonadaceae bacterium]